MFARKRRLRKEGKFWNFKNALAVLFLTVGLSLFFSFVYIHFFLNSSFYINPLLPFQQSSNKALEERLHEKSIEYKKINQENGFIRVYLKDDSEVFFSSKKDIGTQISSLQLTLSRLTIEGKKLKTLDFRFDNPVISFR
ncbi:MAG: hypothetical protein A3B38_01840 [Candidatus Levybacteria bacterium RIFCSPLOWO2_01_FULL_36_13]|nr:MAG: hypothetical protein A2684_03075 [Candidatus Levybacteria bacterium RIFCSPHIGHO2_01_FULL_36_15b]OGH35604.1 MAG: hypothetical protein A3B38_01840 [Candidatus Levybacteria bacterium RIFCSPLOWO2_01_FULL_36_13]